MTEFLFVYGTLKRGMRNRQAIELQRDAEFIEDASCQGRLYLIDRYPGLSLSDNDADIVYGEVYRLRQPAEILARLDRYEGCDCPRCLAEYRRCRQKVTLDQGNIVDAWLYVYNRATENLQYIPGGNFIPPITHADC